MTWSYIAGFFDGEGSLVRHYRGHGFRALIPQTNLQVLEEIQKFTEFGYIFEVTKRKEHWKQGWLYGVSRQSDVLILLKNIQEYTIVKRKLIDEALPRIERRLKELGALKKQLHERLALAYKMRGKGETYRTIGRRLKVDYGYIRKMMKKHPECTGGRSSIG